MSMLDRIRDSFKYLDKNGLKHLIEKIKLHDVHWTGTHAEYEAVKDTLPDYTILHFTDDYDENVEVGIYSTEETKTGELYFNKPVYRRAYIFTTPSTISSAQALYSFDLGLPVKPYIEHIVRHHATLRYSNSSGIGWCCEGWGAHSGTSGTNVFCSPLINTATPTGGSNGQYMVTIAGTHFASQPLELVIEYTRLNDD